MMERSTFSLVAANRLAPPFVGGEAESAALQPRRMTCFFSSPASGDAGEDAGELDFSALLKKR